MAFKMRSGNKPGFKKMGATEAIKQVDTEKAAKGKGSEREIYKAKLRGDYMDLTGDKLKKASYDDHPEELIKGHSIPESPAKQKKTYPKGYTKKDIEFLKKQREDVVRYEDLDAKGKAIWRKQGKPIPKKKKSPAKQYKKQPDTISNRGSGKDKPSSESIAPREQYSQKKNRSKWHHKGESEVKKLKRKLGLTIDSERSIFESPAKQKKDDSYSKKKEQLLTQGFSQVEADQMIKEGGVTGEGKVVHAITMADAMKDPKWRKKIKKYKKEQKKKK